MTRPNDACQDFGLNISLKKTQVMGQDTDSPPAISINDHELDVTHDFVYLGSAISDTLSLDAELNRSYHHDQTDKESMEQQQADLAYKDPDLQSLCHEHSPVLQRVLDIACPTGAKAQRFSHAQPPTHSEHHLAGQGPKQHCPGKMLKQRRMRWLGHVVRMDDGRIPKDLLYGELVQRKRPTGRSQLRFKDVCKRDLKALDIKQNNWEATALKRSAWRQTVQKGLSNFEETLAQQHRVKRMRRKAAAHADRPASDCVYVLCHRD